MFEYLPQICHEIRGQILELFWILLVPFTLITIALDYFRLPESPRPGEILKRVAIALIMLVSFEYIINLISFISDGIVGQINGVKGIKELVGILSESWEKFSFNLFGIRDALIFILGFLSYCLAYVSVVVCEVVSVIIYSIIFVISPFLIMCYVNSKTQGITFSMYKGIIQVQLWKIMWSILGLMLLKISTNPSMANSENFLMTVALNLAIALLMLFVPFAVNSLLSDGLTGVGSKMSLIASAPIAQYAHSRLKNHLGRPVGNAVDKTITAPYRGSKALARTFLGTPSTNKNSKSSNSKSFGYVPNHLSGVAKRHMNRGMKSNQRNNVIKVDFKNKRRT